MDEQSQFKKDIERAKKLYTLHDRLTDIQKALIPPPGIYDQRHDLVSIVCEMMEILIPEVTKVYRKKHEN